MTPIPPARDAVVLPAAMTWLFVYGASGMVPACSWALLVMLLSHAGWMLLHYPQVETQELTGDALRALVRHNRPWSRLSDEKAEPKYASEMIELPAPYYITSHPVQIKISKNGQGAPYIVLPVDIGRDAFDAFWECTIRDREKPTEARLAGSGKAFSQLTLRALKEFYLARGWGELERKGENSGWVLTLAGRMATRYIYDCINGEYG